MNILVLVPTPFPYGVAISSRMVHFCKLLSHMGNKVHVIALCSKENRELNEIYSLDYCTYQIAAKKINALKESFVGNPEFVDAVKQYLEKEPVDVVFMCGVEEYFRRIVKLCSTRGIPFYIEQCEWMDVSSYRLGKFDYRMWRRDYLLHHGYKKVSGVVSISRMLDDHYRSLGIRSVRIPTILDVMSTEYVTQKKNEYLTIVYTGNPSTSKELFRPVFLAIQKHELLRQRISFHIYGPDRQKVLANIGGDTDLLNDVENNVKICGRVPQEKIPDILRNADYQLFLRPSRRSSNAGFPTKFAEAMAVGTPVLTNNTGDIGLYLKDGENGILAKGSTADDVAEALLRAVSMNKEEAILMRHAARKTAEQSFDYRCYSSQMAKLIGSK